MGELHLVVPKEQGYPPPYLLDPLQTLAFVAAATNRIGVGTSVLVGPQYPSPLALANTLASLDYMSGGRLTVGIGIGWSQREYEALGGHFDRRGPRLDEIIRLFRTVWENDPADFTGTHYPSFEQIRVLPAPAHRIPIWVGGRSAAAIDRAVRNDGYHAIHTQPEEAKAMVDKATVDKLRATRPDADFAISLWVSWDVTKMEPSAMAEEADVYRHAGVLVLAEGAVAQPLEYSQVALVALSGHGDLPSYGVDSDPLVRPPIVVAAQLRAPQSSGRRPERRSGNTPAAAAVATIAQPPLT